MPPRTLKAPTGVWFSCFTHTSHPARWLSKGQEYCGVGRTNRRTSSAADSSSAREGSDSAVITVNKIKRRGDTVQKFIRPGIDNGREVCTAEASDCRGN